MWVMCTDRQIDPNALPSGSQGRNVKHNDTSVVVTLNHNKLSKYTKRPPKHFPCHSLASINTTHKLLLTNKTNDRSFAPALPTMHRWIVLTRLGLGQCSLAGDLRGGTAELTHCGDAALANVHRREVEEFGHFTETLFGVRQECGTVTTRCNGCCNSLK